MGTCGAIGIDLGTTFSCVGVYRNGKVEIIANGYNEKLTPSVVEFSDQGTILGQRAKVESEYNPKNTIYSVKRLIGRQFNDVQVQHHIKSLPYKVEEERSKLVIKVKYGNEETEVTTCPIRVSAMILKKMKTTAEASIKNAVENAVVTIPAYFNDAQRQATADAALVAGFKKVEMINEPTAAAIAYGLENRLKKKSKHVLVFDLGGGTFDVSIVKISRRSMFDVLVSTGNTHLGGDDFDERLVKYFCEEFRRKFLTQIKDQRALRRLRMEAEKTKIRLTDSSEVAIVIENLLDEVNFNTKITRSKFEELCEDLFQLTIETVKVAIEDAKLDRSKIDDVVLVGGSTRIPKIESILKKFFKINELKKSVNPDEAVAYGAAIHAAKKFGVDDTSIQEIQISDVTSLSLGIGIKHDVMSTIIKRNTKIPTEATGFYKTVKGNQTAITFEVYEGERSVASENHKVGEFELAGIPSLPLGEGKTKCNMKIDSNGILTVSAVVIANGKTNSLEVSSDRRKLSKIEIEKMIEEAAKLEQFDREFIKCAAVKNDIGNYAYKVESMLKKHGNCISTEDFQNVSNACKQSVEWADSNNSATRKDLMSKLEELKNLCSPIVSKLQ